MIVVAVLRLNRHPEISRKALLESDLAAEAQAAGIVVEPPWANGAKIFVHILADDVPAEIDLRPYHVVVHQEDVSRVDMILQSLPCKQRPLIKSPEVLITLKPDTEAQEKADVLPDFAIHETFVHVPERPWITPRSKYARSCNDVDPEHRNPRALSGSLQELFADMRACHKRLDLPGATRILQTCGAPSIHTFTILIDICGKTGELDEAERWTQVMIDEHNIQPNIVTFNCLINGFAKAGNVIGAVKWFDAMTEAGLEPQQCTYKCMIRTFAVCECWERAESLIEMMRARSLIMDVSTHRTMMDFYARRGQAVKVKECLMEMEDAGLPCGREDFMFVISACANARDLDNAKLWCAKAEAAGFIPGVGEYTQLLKACGHNQDMPAKPEEGRNIFLNQVARSVVPNHDNMEALAEALGKTACQRLCEELHVHTRAANISWWPDPRHFAKPPRLARQLLNLPTDS